MSLYRLIEAQGSDRGLADFRGEIPTPRNTVTLGAYLTEVAATGTIAPRTLRTYATKVGTIAAELNSVRLPKGLNKHDHVHGGAKAWQELVDRTPLSKMAPDV